MRKQTKKANPTGNYMLKVNNRNSRARCEICSKLTITTTKRRQCPIVDFKHISHLDLVFLLLTFILLLFRLLFCYAYLSFCFVRCFLELKLRFLVKMHLSSIFFMSSTFFVNALLIAAHFQVL